MEDESIEKLFYSIGEVSELLNLPASQLRFWEQEFDELNPRKNRKGNRLYTKEDIETIKLIYFLTKERGYTLQGAKDKIQNERHVADKNRAILESLKRLREFLVEMKDNL